MSGAFVKEVDGERWSAPAVQDAPQVGRYRLRRCGEQEVLASSDDLLELLRRAEDGGYEIVDDEHRLMAVC